MLLRHVVYRAIPVLVVALPLWLIVGALAWGSSAWTVVGAIPLAITAFVVLGILAVMSLTPQRARAPQAQPLGETIVWIVLALATIAMGLYGQTFWMSFALAATLGVALFWTLIARLIGEYRERYLKMQRLRQPPNGFADNAAVDIGELTVINVTPDDSSSK